MQEKSKHASTLTGETNKNKKKHFNNTIKPKKGF